MILWYLTPQVYDKCPVSGKDIIKTVMGIKHAVESIDKFDDENVDIATYVKPYEVYNISEQGFGNYNNYSRGFRYTSIVFCNGDIVDADELEGISKIDEEEMDRYNKFVKNTDLGKVPQGLSKQIMTSSKSFYEGIYLDSKSNDVYEDMVKAVSKEDTDTQKEESKPSLGDNNFNTEDKLFSTELALMNTIARKYNIDDLRSEINRVEILGKVYKDKKEIYEAINKLEQYIPTCFHGSVAKNSISSKDLIYTIFLKNEMVFGREKDGSYYIEYGPSSVKK